MAKKPLPDIHSAEDLFSDLDAMTEPAPSAPDVDPRQVLINYLRMKVDQRDWHAVADAAMDLRELEAQRDTQW